MRYFITVLLALFIAYPLNAFACNCKAPQSAAKELSKADLVFTGKIISIDEKLSSSWNKSYTFKAIKTYKGLIKPVQHIDDKPLIITIHDEMSDCSIMFEYDNAYLVYAYKDKSGRYTTSSCSRTAELTQAMQDIEELENVNIPRAIN